MTFDQPVLIGDVVVHRHPAHGWVCRRDMEDLCWHPATPKMVELAKRWAAARAALDAVEPWDTNPSIILRDIRR